MEAFRKWVEEQRQNGLGPTIGQAFNKMHELFPDDLPDNATGDEIYLYNH